MKRMRRSIFCVVALFVWAPMVDAQTADLSKYRDFSIGTSVAVVLSRTGQKSEEVTAISARPALIQQLTWWPGTLPGTPMHKDAVEHIVFNFFNNALYKISVTYERKATEGLTPDDMIESLSAKYGSPANVTTNRPKSERPLCSAARARRILGRRAIFIQPRPVYFFRRFRTRRHLEATQRGSRNCHG